MFPFRLALRQLEELRLGQAAATTAAATVAEQEVR